MNEDENFAEEDIEAFLDKMEKEQEPENQDEDKLNKKSAKIILIPIIGLVIIAGLIFGTKYCNVHRAEKQSEDRAGSSLLNSSKREILPSQDKMRKIEDLTFLESQARLNKTESNVQTLLPPAPEHQGSKISKPMEQSNKKEVKAQALRKSSPPKVKSKINQSLSSENIQQGKYYLQLGSFVIKNNADRLHSSLKERGFAPSKRKVKKKVKMYRVYAGDFEDKSAAEKEIVKLKKTGIRAAYKETSGNRYTLYLESFLFRKRAESLIKKITALGLPAKINRLPVMMDVHKVLVGQFNTKQEAILFQKNLAKKGFSEAIILKQSS